MKMYEKFRLKWSFEKSIPDDLGCADRQVEELKWVFSQFT
jgi:hypothetical protein